MFLVLAYSLTEGLDVLDKSARLPLSLVLSYPASFLYLLDIFEHLFLLLDKLLFKLFKLDVYDVELFFIFYVGFAESICKLLSFCDKKLAVVFSVLIRVDKLLFQLKLQLISLNFSELDLVLESLFIFSRLMFVCEVVRR